MKVFSGYVTSHRSRNVFSKVRERGNWDGENTVTNYCVTGIVPLEKLFDHNDVPHKGAQKENQSTIHRHNIGSPDHPKYINLSTHLSVAQSSEYYTLMKQFSDVFAWEYSDLKTYDKNII